MEDISKDSFIQNGLDINESLPFIPTEMLLSATVGYATTAIVQFLNNNGHPLAAQLLDDQWYKREDQWWREPEGFDGHYLNGQEKRDQIFGPEL